MAAVMQSAFQDNYMGYDLRQRVDLLFKRRTYLTATTNF
jgi:hypothetical protein